MIAMGAVVLAQGGLSFAQDPPLALDRPALLRLASERSPSLLRARSAVAGALSTAEASRGQGVANPIVSLRAGPRFLTGDDRGLAVDLSLGITWPFDLAGVSSARATQYSSAVTTAERSLDEARWRARGECLSEWSNAVIARARSEVARARLANDRELLRTATVRRAAGTVGDGDVAVAEGLVAASEAELSSSEGDLSVALVHLRAELGLAPDARLEVPTPTGEEAAPPPFEALLRYALARPDVLRATAAGVEAERERETQRRYGATLPRFATQVSREEQWSLQVGIELALPLFDRNQTGRAQSDARVRAQGAEREATLLRAETELRAAYEGWSAARVTLRALDRAVTAMTTAEALARRGYELGQRDLSAALVVRREALAVLQQRVDALGRLIRARASLDTAGGALP